MHSLVIGFASAGLTALVYHQKVNSLSQITLNAIHTDQMRKFALKFKNCITRNVYFFS